MRGEPVVEMEKIYDEITKLINAITSIGQPNWFDYLQLFFVFLSVGISVWAVWMAKRVPEKIADNQDKIALFDKRIRYYYACHTIISGGCLVGKEQQIEENLKKQGLEFICYDSDGAEFLFDKETADFISDVFSKWIEYSIAFEFLKNYDGNSATKELFEDYKKSSVETRAFFKSAREQLPRKFKKYLKMI